MQICLADARHLDGILRLIARRIDWMDAVGIRQWNDTAYLDVYPPAYFLDGIRRGCFFVALREGDVAGVMALYAQDPRWRDERSARYVHHLAADPDCPGVGSALLAYAEAYARALGCEALRLDSAVGNERLTRYYESRGYAPVGRCTDGAYEGILREKMLTPPSPNPGPAFPY